MSKILNSLDQMPRRAILLVDLALGVVFGVLPSIMAKVVPIPPAVLDQLLWVTKGLLVGGCVIIPAAVLALLAPGVERFSFLVHALGLVILVLTLIAWAWSLLLNGIPKGVGFSWTPGMLTGLAAWGAFVVGRATTVVPDESRKVRAYTVLGVGLLVLPIDVGTMIRLVYDFLHHAHRAGA